MSAVTQVRNWARIGFVARGLIFIFIGYLALTAGEAQSGADLFDTIEQMPGGMILLAIITVGALGYGLFKISDAIFDLQRHGDDAKGKTKRAFFAAGGAGYLILAFLGLSELIGRGRDGGAGGEQEAAQAVSAAGGEILIIALGIGLLVAGLFQLKKAITREYMDGLIGQTPPGVEIAGMIGYGARGLVMAITGWFVFQAGIGSGEDVVGLSGALNSLRDTDWLFTLVSAGFILFGLFSLIEAKYRSLPSKDVDPRH